MNKNREREGTLRPYSATNPDLLVKSAKTSQSLMLDVKKVMDTLATSKPFSNRLMTAAQASQKSVVIDMIRKIGINNEPDITYNPDGIRFDFYPKAGEVNSHIIVSLKWRDV
ncbi:hypothetical protein [Peribacillus simplex]|uniref:hypothetical protein n=1 Tax=Peribacillus simplex TaxID=1478 RepID=UPI0024C197D1|nr:hypothetical protein [Peribacillus simplex]WHY97247.1 hypothetical protein QNH37_25500 [Peribacillus simplex]